MRFNQIVSLVACGGVAFVGNSLAAGLDGTAVTGSLRFVGNTNFFDPANNRVPAGYGNSSSATNVTIADPGVEFGFADQFSRITADFAGTRLTITETVLSGTDAVLERYSFTNATFAGLTAVTLSNSYPVNLTTAIAGSTLTVNVPSGYSTTTGSILSLSLALTLPGDADLNGTVNFNDFLLLQSSFGNAGTAFGQGNFNADGQTDFNDFLVLQSHFGQTVGGTTLAAATDEQVAALRAFAEVHAVPEPTVLAWSGMIGVSLLRRRRASI